MYKGHRSGSCLMSESLGGVYDVPIGGRFGVA